MYSVRLGGTEQEPGRVGLKRSLAASCMVQGQDCCVRDGENFFPVLAFSQPGLSGISFFCMLIVGDCCEEGK